MTSPDGRPELTELFDAQPAEPPEAVQPVESAEPPVITDEAFHEAEAADSEPDKAVDPVEELRSALAAAPGEWYVVHSYAGYENKVKANLETRVQTLDVEDF
ncbi:MAG TPA: transcription termination/antitermination protein NusG, partial [Pseudonocardiaceae bacterium]|nr:transcription termination/antitermination protein NusG [Pseudonocardiaceae bacterium]